LITSPHNEQLKAIRKLAGRKWRDKLREFVAEGEDLLDAAEAAGWEPIARLVAEGSGLAGEEVAPHLLAQVSQLGSGTRALGVYAQRWAPAPVGPLCLALWGVNDPGNVGTALRSALAFGAGSVALGPGSADPYGPKAVRASMGALFEVPLARVREVGELPGRKVALVARQGAPLDHVAHDARGPGSPCDAAAAITLLIGAEREGLPDEVVAACDEVAHIPIRSESLNAGMAATVALYEIDRKVRAHA
jgi:RNA methyltransferase, TrmH family